jgi:hypothetical protein
MLPLYAADAVTAALGSRTNAARSAAFDAACVSKYVTGGRMAHEGARCCDRITDAILDLVEREVAAAEAGRA